MVEDACESRDRVEFCCAWRLMLVKTLLVVELAELQGGFLEILYGGGFCDILAQLIDTQYMVQNEISAMFVRFCKPPCR